MAQFDYGGGCPCGLQRECDCVIADKKVKDLEMPYTSPVNLEKRIALLESNVDKLANCVYELATIVKKII